MENIPLAMQCQQGASCWHQFLFEKLSQNKHIPVFLSSGNLCTSQATDAIIKMQNQQFCQCGRVEYKL